MAQLKKSVLSHVLQKETKEPPAATAKPPLTLGKLNKLLIIKFLDNKQGNQPRTKGRFGTKTIEEMAFSTLIRHALSNYEVVYMCYCGNEYTVGNSALTHKRRNNCACGKFRVPK